MRWVVVVLPDVPVTPRNSPGPTGGRRRPTPAPRARHGGRMDQHRHRRGSPSRRWIAATPSGSVSTATAPRRSPRRRTRRRGPWTRAAPRTGPRVRRPGPAGDSADPDIREGGPTAAGTRLRWCRPGPERQPGVFRGRSALVTAGHLPSTRSGRPRGRSPRPPDRVIHHRPPRSGTGSQAACRVRADPAATADVLPLHSQAAMLWNSGAAEWPGVPSALRDGASIMIPMT